MKMSFKFIFIATVIVSYSLKMASTTISIVEKYKEEEDNLDPLIRVQCSYMHSAQIYMEVIDELIENKDKLETVPQGKDLSYTNQAAKINATFHNVVGMQNTGLQNVMWIFSMYAERVLAYMESVIKKVSAEDQETIYSVHQAVTYFLDIYMDSAVCAGYKKGKEVDMDVLICSTDDLQHLLTTLEARTSVFMQRIDINANEYGISTDGHEQFSLNKLSLNGLLADMEATKQILEISGVELNWDQVLLHLKKDYDLGTQVNGNKLSQQIKSLKQFHDGFAMLVKVIMIRLMLKFLMHDEYEYNWGENKMALNIVELENYLIPQDDIYEIKSMVENNTKDFQDKIQTIANISIYLSTLDTPYNDPKLRKYSDNKQQKFTDFQQDVIRFVKTFKGALSNINYSIIKQFRRLADSKEYLALVWREKKVEITNFIEQNMA
ncbi:uncharacterized protein LOC126832808 isoform X2 [Adelges cooleyi]|uniref:uncharacterized protein LOC126832808 isoform X2 n=1 Tax=Adelges cooleyi TaxID=133065 RepID=UPI00218056F2|nr:uncharacterized protein LOC126832808 isoform X2 [Adelges cooleyi]